MRKKARNSKKSTVTERFMILKGKWIILINGSMQEKKKKGGGDGNFFIQNKFQKLYNLF